MKGFLQFSAQCDSLITPESGTLTRSTNGTVTTVIFDCSTGYHLHGDSILSCGADGTWNGSEPECRKSWCLYVLS